MSNLLSNPMSINGSITGYKAQTASALGTLRTLMEPALLRNSLWRGQERSTMRQKLSQIGNPG